MTLDYPQVTTIRGAGNMALTGLATRGPLRRQRRMVPSSNVGYTAVTCSGAMAAPTAEAYVDHKKPQQQVSAPQRRHVSRSSLRNSGLKVMMAQAGAGPAYEPS